MDALDVNVTEAPKVTITTREHAVNWIDELLVEMLLWRAKCDVIIPDESQIMVQAQQRALWTFLSKHGQVIGALKSLRLCGLLDERGYKELHQKAINTLIPTEVGVL